MKFLHDVIDFIVGILTLISRINISSECLKQEKKTLLREFQFL